MEEVKKNYIAEYYKNRNNNVQFFNKDGVNDEENSAEISAIKSEIAKLNALLNQKKTELVPLYAKRYTDNYVHTEVTPIARYTTRDGDDKYYSIPDGTLINDSDLPKNFNTYNLDIKSGYIRVLEGYSYEHGGIIVRKYQYKVRADNNSCNFIFLNEYFISVFDEGEGQSMSGWPLDKYDCCSTLNDICGDEFINTMFGVNRDWGKKNLGYFKDKYLRNASFEIIVRTAPDNILYKLLDMHCEEAKPIHKLLGLDKATYDKATEEGLVPIVCTLKPFIEMTDLFYTNISDWLETIKTMKKYEEDLSFFGIRVWGDYDYSERNKYGDCQLLGLLCSNYQKYKVFSDNYSFGKFCKYVIDETINQGYNCVKNFVVELRDYLQMCVDQNINPTFYSSYLKQTHDICARNHKIFIESHQEEIFKDRYKDYKEVKCGNEYCVVAPKDTKDVQREGDSLNHCIGSYVKRVIDGSTLLFFLRKSNKKDESLISMEVRGNAVVQCRGMHNRKTTKEEDEAIKTFAEKQKLKISY